MIKKDEAEEMKKRHEVNRLWKGGMYETIYFAQSPSLYSWTLQSWFGWTLYY